MSLRSRIATRWRALFARAREDRELDEELRFHLEMETAARLRAGMTSAAARRTALRDFGGLERYKEECRDARGMSLLDAGVADLRSAWRSLRKSPAFTSVLVLTLALGIGATTAIFTVVNAVLLQPLPYADAGRLVMLWENDRNSGTTREPASVPDYVDFRTRTHVFSHLAALQPRPLSFTPGAPGADAVQLNAAAVTHDFLGTLGVSPRLGRGFRPDDDAPGAPAVALISARLWHSRFASAPDIIGRSITLGDSARTVIGVLRDGMELPEMPPGFGSLQRDVDVWLPLAVTPVSSPRDNHTIIVIGRLRDGVAPTAAQREVAALAATLEVEYPRANRARGVFVEPLPTSLVRGIRPALAVLLAASALVLLIACANAANLLLARTVARRREVAVRLALGAGMRRLAQQLFAEALLLSLAAAALGVGIAALGLRVLLALAPATIPRLAHVAIDPRVLGVALGIAVLVSMTFGLLPLVMARRLDVQDALRSAGGRGGSAAPAQQRFRNALVVAEVALSVVLVIGAGLLIRSVWSLRGVDLGFQADGLLRVQYQLPASRYPQDFKSFPHWPRLSAFHQELLRRVEEIPGVTSASVSTNDPLEAGFTNSFVIVGREAEAEHQAEIYIRSVSPSYFRTAGVVLRRGRLLSDQDDASAPAVLLINEAGARRYFPRGDAVGQQLMFWGQKRRIVGVVADEKFEGPGAETPPAVYPPIWQVPMSAVSLLVRTHSDPMEVLPQLRAVARDLDPQVALYGVTTMDEALSQSIGKQRFTMRLLGAFAMLALVLAMIGVHGTLSYAVTQRAREMGIRMALGAQRSAVHFMILRQGMLLSLLGIAAGVVGALAATRLLRTLLYGLTATDVATYVAVASIIAIVSALASILPARRATGIDPAVTLRAE